MRSGLYRCPVEHEREWPLDVVVAELRADVRHLVANSAELRADIRRIDERLFQLLVGQAATLAAILGAIVAAALT
jgi:hypothetical protein